MKNILNLDFLFLNIQLEKSLGKAFPVSILISKVLASEATLFDQKIPFSLEDGSPIPGQEAPFAQLDWGERTAPLAGAGRSL